MAPSPARNPTPSAMTMTQHSGAVITHQYEIPPYLKTFLSEVFKCNLLPFSLRGGSFFAQPLDWEVLLNSNNLNE